MFTLVNDFDPTATKSPGDATNIAGAGRIAFYQKGLNTMIAQLVSRFKTQYQVNPDRFTIGPVNQTPDGHPRPGTRWEWRRRTTGAVFSSQETFTSPLEAAQAAAAIAHHSQAIVTLPSDLKDTLVAIWQQEGIALYRAHMPAAACINAYQSQGYEAARMDAQGIAAFGWPSLDMAEVA